MTPQPPRRRRVPTWVIGAVVAAFLSGSVALFVVDATSSDTKQQDTAGRGSTGDDGELRLPDGDGADATDSRRRSDLGRDRSTMDGDDATEGGTTTTGTDAASVAILGGKTIALVPADATAVNGSDASKVQRIGALRVPCAPSGSPAALARQREILDVVATRLRAAGARVVRIDDARGAVPCTGDRSAAFERADLSVVLATGEDAPDTIVARPVGKLPSKDAARARRLVDALGSEVGVDVVASASSAKVVGLLAEHGVVDRPGGGVVAWLSLGDASKGLEAERLAGSIVAALARALAPAGTKPPTRATPATTPGTTPGARPAPAGTIPAPQVTIPTTPKPSIPKPTSTTPTSTTPTSTSPTTTTPTTTTTTPADSTLTGSSGPNSDD